MGDPQDITNFDVIDDFEHQRFLEDELIFDLELNDPPNLEIATNAEEEMPPLGEQEEMRMRRQALERFVEDDVAYLTTYLNKVLTFPLHEVEAVVLTRQDDVREQGLDVHIPFRNVFVHHSPRENEINSLALYLNDVLKFPTHECENVVFNELVDEPNATQIELRENEVDNIFGYPLDVFDPEFLPDNEN